MKPPQTKTIILYVSMLLISGTVSYALSWFMPIMPKQSIWTYTMTPFAFLAVFMGSNALLILTQSIHSKHPTRQLILGFIMLGAAWLFLEVMAQALFIKH